TQTIPPPSERVVEKLGQSISKDLKRVDVSAIEGGNTAEQSDSKPECNGDVDAGVLAKPKKLINNNDPPVELSQLSRQSSWKQPMDPRQPKSSPLPNKKPGLISQISLDSKSVNKKHLAPKKQTIINSTYQDTSVERLIRETDLQCLPGRFESVEEYIRVFEPLLFEECRWYDVTVLPVNECKWMFKEGMSGEGNEEHILRKIQPRGIWFLTVLGSLATTQREYIALHAFHSLNLQMQIAILQPSPEQFPNYDQQIPAVPECFTQKFAEHLNGTFNGPQLSAIQWAAMHCRSGTTKRQEPWPFTLVQGPPGTGKTHTVWGMLNVIHLVQYQHYYNSLLKKLAPESYKQPSEGSSDNNATGSIDEVLQSMDQSLFRTLPKLCPKPRMLVCAPSNAATDELLARVLDPGFIDGEMRIYKPDVARVGAIPVERRTGQLLAMGKEEEIAEIQIKLNSAAAAIRSQGSVGVDPDVLMARDQNRDALLKQLAQAVENRDKVLVEMSRILIVEVKFRTGSNFNLDEARASLEASYANEAEIVFTTFSSSGRKLFSRLSHGFDMVVIDEAAQASEYRMHPQIRDFPSRYLSDSGSVVKLPDEVYYRDPLLRPYLFYDITHGRESHRGGSVSYQNIHEAQFCLRIYEHLQKTLKSMGMGKITMGIITPYKLQLKCLQREFEEVLNSEEGKDIYINTVDAFQGQERDVIIMSRVRASSHGVGFVADIRRLNVALTRARRALWVVGNASALIQSEDWAALIDDAKARNCYMDMDSVPKEFYIPKGPTLAPLPGKAPLNSRGLRSCGSRHRLTDTNIEPRSVVAPEDDEKLPASLISRNGNFRPLKPPVENSLEGVDQSQVSGLMWKRDVSVNLLASDFKGAPPDWLVYRTKSGLFPGGMYHALNLEILANLKL
ncbi:LOW QUALITY PROTEIN: hypothetical protein EUGRSUZ_E01930, partial [Eucalyptus grandis]